MQVAKLTQEYYGAVRRPAAPDRPVAADQQQPKRLRNAVPPAERLVEGELLRSRKNPSGTMLEEILQRGRFAHETVAAQDGAVAAQTARRAINTYLDHAASPRVSNVGPLRGVDYYV